MEIFTLGSGSSGNAALVRSGGTAVLVDAGLSARQLTARLAACGVTPGDLSGVLVTHEHGDHTGALRVLLAKHRLPVYCNALTGRALRDAGLAHVDWRVFQNGGEFAVGDLRVRAFSVPHDAADPVGFRISAAAGCFGVLTDLGYATRSVFEALRGVRGLLIETNYDEALLQQDTRRPWSVKQRITSRHGHLSNSAAAAVVAELDAPLQHVILAHLSRDCNAPDLAVASVTGAINGRPAAIYCATQETVSPALRLT